MVALLLARGANPESQEHDSTVLGFALHPWVCVHDLGSGELLLRQDAKAEADIPLNGIWMYGGLRSRRESAVPRDGVEIPVQRVVPSRCRRSGERS
jgi:hypothetical protein